MKKILGVSSFYHDSAASIIIDGKVIAAAQEERFNRIKNSSVFPVESIKFCLNESKLTIDELDAVVFYDKPFLKFERLLETYYAFAPRGILSFLQAIPVWLQDKLFIKKRIMDGLKEVQPFDKKKVNLLFSEHHLSHAASSFYTSNMKESAILTIDGVGEWNTASICIGKDNKIRTIKNMNFPHSVGLLYSAFTYYLGFKVNSGEYKMMGLAPYGDPNSQETLDFIDKTKSKIVDIKKDGSIWLNQHYFNYTTGLTMTHSKRWLELFGIPRRSPESKISQAHCNLAYAIQQVTEEIVLKMAIEAKKLTGSENLCLAGGVALNCVSNGKLLEENIFNQIHIQPAAGDAGGAIGAALAVHYQFYHQERTIKLDTQFSPYLGPSFSEKDIEFMAKEKGANFNEMESYDALCVQVSKDLSLGKVVGWFQGKMEFGPRALGNRSILGDASSRDMQEIMNSKIKFRESFRPFAPAVLQEESEKYFNLKQESPYMLFTAQVNNSELVNTGISNSNNSMMNKIKETRSTIPAVTHVDNSARIQTVTPSSNSRFHKLLQSFKDLTNRGILINTSFNVRGEPIVCTPKDAFDCFMKTGIDILVINDYYFTKPSQSKI